MLYEVSVESIDKNFYCDRIIEAPRTKRIAGDDAIPEALFRWAEKYGQEQSVIWGFCKVHVTVSKYTPMRVGFENEPEVVSCFGSVVAEWDDKVTPSQRVQRLTKVLQDFANGVK